MSAPVYQTEVSAALTVAIRQVPCRPLCGLQERAEWERTVLHKAIASLGRGDIARRLAPASSPRFLEVIEKLEIQDGGVVASSSGRILFLPGQPLRRTAARALQAAGVSVLPGDRPGGGI